MDRRKRDQKRKNKPYRSHERRTPEKVNIDFESGELHFDEKPKTAGDESSRRHPSEVQFKKKSGKCQEQDSDCGSSTYPRRLTPGLVEHRHKATPESGEPEMKVAQTIVQHSFREEKLLLLTCGPYGNVTRWIPSLIVTEA